MVIDQVFYLVVTCIVIYSSKLAFNFYYSVVLVKEVEVIEEYRSSEKKEAPKLQAQPKESYSHKALKYDPSNYANEPEPKEFELGQIEIEPPTSPQGFEKPAEIEDPESIENKGKNSPTEKPRRKRTLSENFILEPAITSNTPGKNAKTPMLVKKPRHKRKNVTKILFCGGPSAGKTTAISTLTGYLRDLGHLVLIVPDVEKIILNNVGVNGLPKANKDLGGSKKIDLHYSQLRLQMMLEDTFTNIIVQNPNKPNQELFLLIENGALDQKAYTTPNEWSSILVEAEKDEAQLLSRYDMVVHMITAADGAMSYFDHLNKSEPDAKQCISLDRALRKAYMYHPNFYIIGNTSVKNFSEKVNIAKNYVLNRVFDYQSTTQFHKKFLIKDENGHLFHTIVNEHHSSVVEIEDIFIKSTPEECKYIRKRVFHLKANPRPRTR